MKGFPILILLTGTFYYLYNHTEFFDEEKSSLHSQYEHFKNMVGAATRNTNNSRDNKDWIRQLRNQLNERMSRTEMAEFELLISDKSTIIEFNQKVCQKTIPTHSVFSIENTRLLCDNLVDKAN